VSFQDIEKEVIAAVLGQGLLESERLVHLLDDCRIRPEAPPKISIQVSISCIIISVRQVFEKRI
jgi:hypothetical protein